ncbi:MAG TPA: hypothetical protein VFB82_19800 [Blastocatellia bacterium]|jgi:hypothetical protein|nr:hypothetical protein [Blastocatellia bacterium]
MESNTSQKKARLIVAAVFVIGFAAGALSLNLYQHLTSSQNKDHPRGRTEYILGKMNKEVGLTSDQQDNVKKILDETGEKYFEIRKDIEPVMKPFEPRFEAVRQESRNRIRSLLREEQLPKFEEMVRKQDEIREKERERLKK